MNKIGHYSGFSEANGFGFTAGIIGSKSDGYVAHGMEAQVTTAIGNLKVILESRGLDLSSVIKTTVFITSNDDYLDMDESYKKSFEQYSPARSTVIVKGLPQVKSDGPEPILFEIEAVVALLVDLKR